MDSVFDGQVTGQGRAPPATAEGRWSRQPREGPGQRPRPARGTAGPPDVPGHIPGRAGPGRAGRAVLRPARRPPPRHHRDLWGAQSLRRTVLRRPAQPQGRSHQARTPVAASPVPPRRRCGAPARPGLARLRCPTPGPPRPHSRPGLTESRRRRRRACPGSRPRE